MSSPTGRKVVAALTLLLLVVPSTLVVDEAFALPYAYEHEHFNFGDDPGFVFEGPESAGAIRRGWDSDSHLDVTSYAMATGDSRTYSAVRPDGFDGLSTFSLFSDFRMVDDYPDANTGFYPLVVRSGHAQDLDRDPNVAFVEFFVAPNALGILEAHVRFGYRDGMGVLRQHVESLGLPSTEVRYRASIEHSAATGVLRLTLRDTDQVSGLSWSVQTGTFRDATVPDDDALTNSLFHFDRAGVATSTRGSGGSFTGRIHNMTIARTTCAPGSAIGGPHPCQDSIREDFEDGEFRELRPTLAGWAIRSGCAQPPSGTAYWGYESDACAGVAGGQRAHADVNLSTATRAQLRFDQFWEHESTEPDEFLVLVHAPGASEEYRWSPQGTHPPGGTWSTLTLDLATFAGTPTPVTIEFVPTSGAMRWLLDDVRLMMVTTNGAPVPVVEGPDVLHGVDSNGTRRVDLDGSASYDPDGDEVVLTWRHEGRIVARGPAASVWLPYGTHVVSLGAEDGQGVEMLHGHSVKINRHPSPRVDPWLVNTSDKDGSGSEPVLVDARKSYDEDGRIVDYEWRIQETWALLLSGPDASAPVLDFGVGWHNLSLKVTDDDGASTWTSARVVVHPNTPPVVSMNVSHEVLDDRESDGEVVTLDGCGSYDPEGGPLEYRWSGGVATEVFDTCKANVTLRGATVQVVSLTVVDQGGGENTSTATVVLNHPPNPDMTVDCYQSNCTFEARLSTDPDGDSLAYAWRFPWGLSGTGETLTQAFPSSEAFRACLVANDSRLETETCQTVYPVYTEDFDDGDFRSGAAAPALSGAWRVFDARDCAPPPPTGPFALLTGPTSCSTAREGLSSASLKVQLPTTPVDLQLDHWWDLSQWTEMRLVVRNALGMETILRAWQGTADPESGGWVTQRFDLASFVGQEVMLELQTTSPNSFQMYAWRVDGIHLVVQGQPEVIDINGA